MLITRAVVKFQYVCLDYVLYIRHLFIFTSFLLEMNIM